MEKIAPPYQSRSLRRVGDNEFRGMGVMLLGEFGWRLQGNGGSRSAVPPVLIAEGWR